MSTVTTPLGKAQALRLSDMTMVRIVTPAGQTFLTFRCEVSESDLRNLIAAMAA